MKNEYGKNVAIWKSNDNVRKSIFSYEKTALWHRTSCSWIILPSDQSVFDNLKLISFRNLLRFLSRVDFHYFFRGK
jgi:hypothetical protein